MCDPIPLDILVCDCSRGFAMVIGKLFCLFLVLYFVVLYYFLLSLCGEIKITNIKSVSVIITFSLCMVFHNGLGNRKCDGRVNTSNDRSAL